MGLRLIGPDLECALVVLDRLVQPALLGESTGEIVVGFGEIRREAQGLAVLRDRFFGTVQLFERHPEIVVALGDARLQLERAPQLGRSLLPAALLQVRAADRGVGGVGVAHLTSRDGDERRVVLPVPHLRPGQRRPRARRDREKHGENGPRPQRATRDLPCGESDDDRQTDHRHVRVAIGHRLQADLHEPDHGHERAEEPEPADGKPGTPSSSPQRHRGRTGEEQRGAGDLEGGKRGEGVGIVRGEVGGPRGFRDVGDPGDDGVLDAQDERDRLAARHRSARALHEERHDARRDRKEKEGDLLQHELLDARSANPSERPDVEEEQRERERHDHRLREEP